MSINRTCIICGKGFIGRNGVTCSNPCRFAFGGRVRRERARARMRALVKTVGEIPLTNGGVAYVDPEDFDRAMAHLWHAERREGRTYVASIIDGKSMRLHRFLMNAPVGIEVDHKNGDGLDNRRSTNLRFATHAENNTNRHALSPSGYRGVTLSRGVRWQSQLKHNGKLHYLGVYPTPEEAARAYDVLARQIFGKFARLNFPQEGEQQA